MKKTAAIPSSWEDLPPDLLGLVLLRLPSLADRVHLRAVCRPWRAGASARRHPLLPPLLPWLAFRDGSLVDHGGAPVRCGPILRDGVSGYLVVDNLAFLVHDDGDWSLMNPLSGLTLPLPNLGPAVRRAIEESESYIRKTHAKAILSSPLDSTADPLVATIIMGGQNVVVSACNCKQHDAVTIRMCAERSEWPNRTMAADIAFLDRKLYILTMYEGLRIAEVDFSQLRKPIPSFGFHQCIAEDPTQQEVYNFGDRSSYYVLRYLAESNGRLLMVRRWMSVRQHARQGDHDKTVGFQVFAADLTTIPGQWTKVESLGAQALFISSECTKSVPASQYAGGVKEDCIYFMHRTYDHPSNEIFGPCVDPLGDSGVYNRRDGEIRPLLPEVVMAELQEKRQFLTWFFPADA